MVNSQEKQARGKAKLFSTWKGYVGVRCLETPSLNSTVDKFWFEWPFES